MSFNRLPYDTCAYEQVLSETTGPGAYYLTTPQNTCEPCHTNNPYIRLQSQAVKIINAPICICGKIDFRSILPASILRSN